MKSKIDLAEHVIKLTRDVHGKDKALRRVRRQLREARSDAADVQALRGAVWLAYEFLGGARTCPIEPDGIQSARDLLHDTVACSGGSNENQVHHDAARLAKRPVVAAPELMTPEIEVKWVDISPTVTQARVGGFPVATARRSAASPAAWGVIFNNYGPDCGAGTFATRTVACAAVEKLVRERLLGAMAFKVPERAEPAPPKRQLADGIQGVILNERAYQKRKHGDRERPVSEFLMIMRAELDEAHDAWLKNSDEDALEELTQVVTVGVACMEQHGPREGHHDRPDEAKSSGAACGGHPDATTVHERAQAPKIEIMPDRWSQA